MKHAEQLVRVQAALLQRPPAASREAAGLAAAVGQVLSAALGSYCSWLQVFLHEMLVPAGELTADLSTACCRFAEPAAQMLLRKRAFSCTSEACCGTASCRRHADLCMHSARLKNHEAKRAHANPKTPCVQVRAALQPGKAFMHRVCTCRVSWPAVTRPGQTRLTLAHR